MSGTLRVEIVRAEALDATDIALWHAMVAGNPDLASPYFHPDFTRIAARVSPYAAVAVFRRGNRTIGYFPHQRRGSSIQPLAAPMNDYHGVIALPGEAPSLEEVATVMKATRLNVGAWVGFAATGEPRETVMVTMPDGFEAWYAERRKSWSKYYKDKERARRSLETELGEVRVELGLRDPALLDHLIDLKRAQYRRTGRHDVFACGWTRQLLHDLMEGGADNFGGSLAAMWAGGKLTAVEFSLHGGGHYHFWFPAYEPGLSRCSPGILLSLETMRQASDQGYEVFDFGFGGEGYKKYFCDTSQIVQEALIQRPGLRASVTGAVAGVMATAGPDRAEKLKVSVRRRWSAIEACETNRIDRVKGALGAVGAALSKATSKPVPPTAAA
ncbi:MAG: GNAT family N-acetyltransferase [Alphaproteobacteria bacterium]|nr:MAG: GNAT family N-acetyltransferase [Alphaproteobacteria bacterium]